MDWLFLRGTLYREISGGVGGGRHEGCGDVGDGGVRCSPSCFLL